MAATGANGREAFKARATDAPPVLDDPAGEGPDGRGPSEPGLPEELRRAAAAVGHAALTDPYHRVVSVFLGTDAYARADKPVGDLRADLLLECLLRFLAARGGRLVHSMSLREGSATAAGFKHITVDGQARPVLDRGMAFLDLGGAGVDGRGGSRAVLGVRRSHYGGGENVCELKLAAAGNAAAILGEWEAHARRDNYLRGRVAFADGTLVARQRRHSWDDIVLAPAALDAVRLHVDQFLRNRDRLRRLGVKARRGLILSGPPGTGKTLLCKILAHQLEASVLWVLPRHVRSPWSIDAILDVARFVAPTVLFLEDLDLYAEEREAEKSMLLGELMNQLDGAVENEDLVTVASTNRLHVVERALRNRPGRFDRIVRLDLPDEACRRRLLERLLFQARVAAADLALLAHHTYGYSGAQLEEVVNTIFMMAVEAGVGAEESDVAVDRTLIDRALAEVSIERRRPIGFH